MGAKCCKQRRGACRCNYRYAQSCCVNCVPSCCNTCCAKCGGCGSCLALPDPDCFYELPGVRTPSVRMRVRVYTRVVRTVLSSPPVWMQARGWETHDENANQFFNDISLTRIVPRDNTRQYATRGPAAPPDKAEDLSGREPFNAHLCIWLDPDDNLWLKENPEAVSLFMEIDGGYCGGPDFILANNAGHSLSPFETKFHFIVDRSWTMLSVVLRKKPWGETKRLFGEGHKAHEVTPQI